MLMNCPSFSAAPRILVRLDTSRRTLASDMNTLLPCELPPAVRRIDSDAAPHDNEAARAAMSALSMSCLAQIKWETHIHNETACLFWMRGLCLLAERLEPGRQLLYALDGTRRHYAHRRHRFPVPPRRPMRDLLASRVAARLRYHWFQEWNQCDRFRAVQSMSAAAFSEMRCLEPTRRRGVLGRTQGGAPRSTGSSRSCGRSNVVSCNAGEGYDVEVDIGAASSGRSCLAMVDLDAVGGTFDLSAGRFEMSELPNIASSCRSDS